MVTVLFCDLMGSTALGDRTDPERLRALMNRYYEAARGVLERHGGTVEKFVGDAVMAVLGFRSHGRTTRCARVHDGDGLAAELPLPRREGWTRPPTWRT